MASGNAGMEKLIPIVNELQAVCKQMGTTLEFDLPQIAVIGSQSAGKSSVLENFVGRDFLPRGNGIVTRRPLILQLINGPEEYGEFDHCKEDPKKCRRFDNFADIRAEIEAETNRLTGKNKGISSEEIILRIYSPKVVDLTLVDLPGIIKNPDGDQPIDMEKQIKSMILKYIDKKKCLILAVSPANADLANSDAIQLAKEVDKDGSRTIGVITKLDLMDEGTDARDIFEGKLLPLSRGYIGVVNRSQKDINNQKDIEATLQAEREFFSNHSYYQGIASRLGTPYLQKVLNQQLKEHIHETMGSSQEETRTRMDALKKDISSYENLHPSDPSRMRKVMIKLILQLQSDFDEEMGSLGSDDVLTERLSRGAKIRRIFHERLPHEISKIQYNENELRHKIENAIENAYGFNGVFNTPFKAFEGLVKKQIELFENPIKVCIKSVVEELSNAVQTCIKNISSHQKFRNYIENYIMTFIHDNSMSNQQNILSLVEMESAYMNSMHYEFKNYKQNELAAKHLERVAAIHGDLNFNQKKGLVDHLARSLAAYMSTAAPAQKSEDEVIREGTLTLGDDVMSPQYWFVLKTNTLSCYDVDDHSKMHSTFQLGGLKFCTEKEDGAFASSKERIILFEPSGGNVHQDHEKLKLSSASAVDICLWKKSLSRVIESDDEKNVDVAYEEITSYTRIVRKTMCDMVPKAITLFIIRKFQTFIKEDLLSNLPGMKDDEILKLFGADEKEIKNYNEMKEMHETCKKALEIMSECT